MTRALRITDQDGLLTRWAAIVITMLLVCFGFWLALPIVTKDSHAIVLAHQVRDADLRAEESRKHISAMLDRLDDGKAVFVAWDTLRPVDRREVSYVSRSAARLFGVSRSTPVQWTSYAHRMRDISLGRDVDAPSVLDMIRAAIAGNSGAPGMLHTVDGVKYASLDWFVLEDHVVCVFALRDAEPFYHQLRLQRPDHDEPSAHARH